MDSVRFLIPQWLSLRLKLQRNKLNLQNAGISGAFHLSICSGKPNQIGTLILVLTRTDFSSFLLLINQNRNSREPSAPFRPLGAQIYSAPALSYWGLQTESEGSESSESDPHPPSESMDVVTAASFLLSLIQLCCSIHLLTSATTYSGTLPTLYTVKLTLLNTRSLFTVWK